MEGKQPIPHKPIIPKNTSNLNFKRAILFSIVERSSNYVFGDVNLPSVLRARAVNLLMVYI